ncbi:hypothetical protein L6R50_18945 [Myxococcota bacterium]|nr:hypothetical protein [Myxococcota bacterium]
MATTGMMGARALLGALVLAVGAPGCALEHVRGEAEPTTDARGQDARDGRIGPVEGGRAPIPERDRGDEARMQVRGFVPMGTRFTVSMDQALPLQRVRVGQEFTARTVEAVEGADGEVLIPVAATLTGEVVAVRRARNPMIAVQFHSIETVSGEEVPIDIAVLEVDVQRRPGAPRPRALYADPEAPAFGTTLSERWLRRYPPTGGRVRGQEPVSAIYLGSLYSPGEARVPETAELRLILTRPLVLPAEGEGWRERRERARERDPRS